MSGTGKTSPNDPALLDPMTRPTRSRLTALDYALGITVPLTWGLGLVFAKAAIAHFPPILLMSFRFLVTALPTIYQ